MALQIIEELENGVVVDYHRLGPITYDKDNKTIKGVILKYIDKTTRDAGKYCVGSAQYELSNIEIESMGNKDPYKLAYIELKTQKEQYSTAQDI